MTMPLEYARASEEFDRFVEELRQRLDHGTRHRTYRTIESVLIVFRRRLSVEEAVAFAGVLPAVLRAIFVAEWDVHQEVVPFTDRAAMTREVQAYRINHDFSPDTAISDMASVLRRHVDARAFDRVLARLPEGASAFWTP